MDDKIFPTGGGVAVFTAEGDDPIGACCGAGATEQALARVNAERSRIIQCHGPDRAGSQALSAARSALTLAQDRPADESWRQFGRRTVRIRHGSMLLVDTGLQDVKHLPLSGCRYRSCPQ